MRPAAFLSIFFISGLLFAKPTIPLQTGTSEEILASIESVVAKGTKNTATINELNQALTSDQMDIRVKERAAWALGQLKADQSVKPLMEAANNKGLLVRSAALNALVNMRSKTALPIYIEIAENDPILSLRQRATLGLGLSKSEKAIDPVVKLSSDEREEIRGASVLAMAALHSSKHNFSQILAEMAADPSPYVQMRAKTAQDLISGKHSLMRTHLSSTDADVRLFTANIFRSKGNETDLEALKKVVKTESDEDVRAEMESAIKSIRARLAEEKKAQANTPTTKPSPIK